MYRPRVSDLLQTVRGFAGDSATRLVLLRELATKLEELFSDLVAAGDHDPSVKALGEVVLRLHALLAESQPAETEILDVSSQIEKCLQSWLGLGETTPRRRRIWK